MKTIRNSNGTFAKGSQSRLGTKASKKTRLKQRQAKLENPTKYWLGKKRTDLGGKVLQRKNGYRYIAISLIEKEVLDLLPDSHGRPIAEHWYVWVKHNRTAIPAKYHIHHINKVKSDNRIENLRILTDSEHSSLHNPKGKKIGNL